MNSIIVFEHEYQQKRIHIRDSYRLTHLREVLKGQVGRQYQLTILNRGLTLGTLTNFDHDQVIFEQTQELHAPEQPSWHLVVGLSRPPTMKKILEHATSLGVTHFHFFPATLSEKSYADSKLWQEDRTQKHLLDGLAQSAHYWQLPQIHHYSNMSQLPDFSGMQRVLFSLEEGAQALQLSSPKSLVMAFGPERGWTKQEDAWLRKHGFQAVKLAPSVLRVEIAAFAALGQAHLLLE